MMTGLVLWVLAAVWIVAASPPRQCAMRQCGFVNATRSCLTSDREDDQEERFLVSKETSERRINRDNNDDETAACPKVYVYDLPRALYDLPWRPRSASSSSSLEECERPVTPHSHKQLDRVFGAAGKVAKPRDACPGLEPAEAYASLYATQQWGAAEMLLYRAVTSLRCPRARDPKEADLFLVPALPKAKSNADWNTVCKAKNASEAALVAALPYLTPLNAHRHLLVLGKGMPNAKKCLWFVEPNKDGLVRYFVRFAYSARVLLPHDEYDVRRAKPRYGPLDLPRVPPSPAEWARSSSSRLPPELDRFELSVAPNLVSIPYPASVHLSRDTPATRAYSRVRTHRDVLMSFQGSVPKTNYERVGENVTLLADKHYGARVRSRLLALCRTLPERLCLVDDLAAASTTDGDHHKHKPQSTTTTSSSSFACFRPTGRRASSSHPTASNKHFDPAALERVKGRSVFCLEPLGDSPYRKSLWDALAFGCIPVVFSLYADVTAPWHWGDWRDDSRVYVPEHRLFQDDFDLVAHLQAIPADVVRHMQDTIARRVHRVIYAVDDVPHDAYETLVRRAHREATDFEEANNKRRRRHTHTPPASDVGIVGPDGDEDDVAARETDALQRTGQWLVVGTH